MIREQEIILLKIREYLSSNPEIRFCQALHNLNINQFPKGSEGQGVWRDNYNDKDVDVLERMPITTVDRNEPRVTFFGPIN